MSHILQIPGPPVTAAAAAGEKQSLNREDVCVCTVYLCTQPHKKVGRRLAHRCICGVEGGVVKGLG